MPVLPLVGSMIVAPGLRMPRRSASLIMLTAMRSLTLYPGWKDSNFASTVAPAGTTRFRRTSGVFPINCVASSAQRAISVCLLLLPRCSLPVEHPEIGTDQPNTRWRPLSLDCHRRASRHRYYSKHINFIKYRVGHPAPLALPLGEGSMVKIIAIRQRIRRHNVPPLPTGEGGRG